MTNHSFFQCPFRNLDISEVVLLKRGDYLYFEKKKQLVEEIDIWANDGNVYYKTKHQWNSHLMSIRYKAAAL